MKIPAIDCFCGAGGWAQALKLLGLESHAYVSVAINHDDKAIAANKRNHPESLHLTDDVRQVNPYKLAESHPAKILFWSAECTHFSGAKGGDSRDPDSRMLSEQIFPFTDAFKFDLIFVENVREFMHWGPVREKRGKDGTIRVNAKTGRPILEPDPKRKGEYYFRWINRLQEMGYTFDWRILNAADFGAYTSRRRYFAVFVRKDLGLSVQWPRATHTKTGREGNALVTAVPKWKACRDVIDIHDKGESILFERHAAGSPKSILSPNTLARMRAGLQKYWKEAKVVQMVDRYHSDSMPVSINEPMPTLMASMEKSFVSIEMIVDPSFMKTPQSLDAPLTTILASRKHKYLASVQLIDPHHFLATPKSLDDPAPTIMACRDSYLFSCDFIVGNYSCSGKPVAHTSLDSPLPTIATKDRFAMINVQFLENRIGSSHNHQSLRAPLGTIMTNPKQSLISVDLLPSPDEQPFILELASQATTVPASLWKIYGPYRVDRRIANIHYRMLYVKELKLAQGFPAEY
ncbi:MAG TPA: DNA cytosine methyltransferase, partial [Bacteroidia bacterium]|nr:DNA cytosine methyltransferase [Bacteroidia bacterium]